jgi:hypothetical protein
MKTSRLFLLIVGLPLAAFADPVEDLNQAIQRFQGHHSYTWETIIEPSGKISNVPIQLSFYPPEPFTPSAAQPNPEYSPNRMRVNSVPIVGTTDKEQGTMLTTSTTTRISSRSDRLTGTIIEEGIPTILRAVIRGNQAVAELPSGWLNAQEIGIRVPGVLPSRRASPKLPPARTASSEPADQQSRVIPSNAVTYAAHLLISLLPPAEELSALLADANTPRQVGKTIAVTLSAATAGKFVYDLRSREGSYAVNAEPSVAEGVVTIWLKSGEISKYEVTVQFVATSQRDSGPTSSGETVKLVKTTSIRRFDVAPATIPREALAKLAP